VTLTANSLRFSALFIVLMFGFLQPVVLGAEPASGLDQPDKNHAVWLIDCHPTTEFQFGEWLRLRRLFERRNYRVSALTGPQVTEERIAQVSRDTSLNIVDDLLVFFSGCADHASTARLIHGLQEGIPVTGARYVGILIDQVVEFSDERRNSDSESWKNRDGFYDSSGQTLSVRYFLEKRMAFDEGPGHEDSGNW
jgi:hypothetical protein